MQKTLTSIIFALVALTASVAPLSAAAYSYCNADDDCYFVEVEVAPYYSDGYSVEYSYSDTYETETSADVYCDEYEDGYDCVHYVNTNTASTIVVPAQNQPIVYNYPTYTASVQRAATSYPYYYPVYIPAPAQPIAKKSVTVTSKPTKQNGFVVKRTYTY